MSESSDALRSRISGFLSPTIPAASIFSSLVNSDGVTYASVGGTVSLLAKVGGDVIKVALKQHGKTARVRIRAMRDTAQTSHEPASEEAKERKGRRS